MMREGVVSGLVRIIARASGGTRGERLRERCALTACCMRYICNDDLRETLIGLRRPVRLMHGYLALSLHMYDPSGRLLLEGLRFYTSVASDTPTAFQRKWREHYRKYFYVDSIAGQSCCFADHGQGWLSRPDSG